MIPIDKNLYQIDRITREHTLYLAACREHTLYLAWQTVTPVSQAV
jgi:hypothetical protein